MKNAIEYCAMCPVITDIGIMFFATARGRVKISGPSASAPLLHPPLAHCDAHASIGNTSERIEAANVIVRGSTAAFAQEILTGSHRLRAGRDGSCKADTDTGPQDLPLTTFCSVGSCTSMTVAMYARRKSWPLEQ